MFSEPLFAVSRHVRAGAPQLFSEFVATFGLLAVIWGSPVDVPGFIVAQLAGAAAATALFRWLVPSLARDARDVVVAHPSAETDPS